jgi:hypothetical protein
MFKKKDTMRRPKTEKVLKSLDIELTPEQKALEREKLMAEFLAKGGKVEKVPYGVTNQELGTANNSAGWNPPTTITPKTWRTRKTKQSKTTKKKKDK